MNEFTRKFVEGHMRRMGMAHAERAEELVAAFMVRHGIDPTDARVVTEHRQHEDGTMTLTTHIERKPHGTKRRH
jgi:hypothetical protein